MPDLAIGRALAAACVALAAFSAGAQTMYKWVDEKGTTHFSQDPPPDGKAASKVEPKVTPPSSGAVAPKGNTETWRAQDAEFRKRQIERGQREQAESREKAERAQNCSQARRRLGALERASRIYRENDDGTRTYLEESQREATIAEARGMVKEHCD